MDTGAFRVLTAELQHQGVLIVGGEQLLRRGLARSLDNLGFEATTVAARNFGDQDPADFALILALIDLDNLDGYSVLEGLTLKAGKTPVIAVGERSSRGKVVEKLLGRPLAYLSLPIHETQLKDAVRRVLAPAPKLDDAPTERWDQPWQRPDLRLTEVIDSLRSGETDLPTIGPIAMELHQLLHRPTAGVEETVGVVQRDPAVAAGVLRLANSSRYRAIVPITTLRNACLRLGNKTVVALAQEAVLRDLFALGAGPVQQIAHAMWQSVTVTSQGARQIAIEKGIPDPDEVQVAAMFHNIGELVLMRATAGLYRDPKRWENPIFLASLGREVADCHGEVGALLLKSWEMDESFIRVTQHHHAPDDIDLTERERTLCNVVLAAWAGAEQAGFGWRLGGRRTRAHRALYALHLTEPELQRIFDNAESWVTGSLPVTHH